MIWGLVIAGVVLAAALAVKYFLPEVIEEDHLVWAVFFGFLVLFTVAAVLLGYFLPSSGEIDSTFAAIQ